MNPVKKEYLQSRKHDNKKCKLWTEIVLNLVTEIQSKEEIFHGETIIIGKRRKQDNGKDNGDRDM